jgi:hypothetical protein
MRRQSGQWNSGMRRFCILGFFLLFTAHLSFAAQQIDDSKAAAEGIRKLSGKRLTLYTDLPSSAEVNALPSIFDQAFPQWCDYFKVKKDEHADWRVTGFLMKDKKRFDEAGLPVQTIRHGYSQGDMFWLNEQPSDYYRRELFLHEGTHCFMITVLGSSAPPWYMEGMAEYLGTHCLTDGRLTLGYFPKNREEAPKWGRVRIIQDAVAAHKAMPIKSVIEYSSSAHLENEPYAWCWAAVTLLDRHPRYQERFRKLALETRQPDFNERFFKLFEPDWRELCEEGDLMIANMEYGYDVARSAVDFTPGKSLSSKGSKIVVLSAERGWQNSGVRLEGGKKYRLAASGRYQVAKGDCPNFRPGENGTVPLKSESTPSKKPKIWWCEPGGVSIRYYQGLPLGMLLAAVRPDPPGMDKPSALLHPIPVGLGADISPSESGTLFLKINDSAGELGDNAGELKVEVRRE